MPVVLKGPTDSMFQVKNKVYRENIELEKGVVLTQSFLERNELLFQSYLQIFSAYPDIYLDLIKPTESNINLYPFQRIFLRACMRYKAIYITAARATSKTFLSILALYLQCCFVPNHSCFIVAPNKNQAAKISRQKILEIWRYWPLLRKELVGEDGNFGKDYVDLKFKNGAKFSIVGALDSDRGLRNHGQNLRIPLLESIF